MQDEKQTTEINERIKEITDDLKKVSGLDALRDSSGGQILVESLVFDIIGAIESLAENAHQHTHENFIVLSVRIKERLDIIRVLNGAKSNTLFLREELKKELEKIQP